MPSRADELVFLAERGDRIAEVRKALALSGDDFANAVNRRGDSFGVSLGYDKTKVSRVEGGKATFFTAEEAVVIASLDPESRGIEWLVFGRRGAKQGRGTPAVKSTDATRKRA